MDVSKYLAEDVGKGDITSEALVGDGNAKGVIKAKEDCVLGGLEEAIAVFRYLGLQVYTEHRDGESIEADTTILEISGKAKSILLGERVALNFLMKMSGIASLTRELTEVSRKRNPSVKIAATRKTTPGFRYFEKKAVRLGGGDPHRYGLDDAFLIKDNHIRIVGSVSECVKRAKRSSVNKKVEVEAETEEEALEAAKAGADVVMLDNMTPDLGRRVTAEIREISDAKIEASGGITPQNISEYADFPDVISLGFLTHSVTAKDFSLEIIETF